MGVVFTEGRGLPPEFQRGSGYEGFHGFGDEYQDGAAKIARAVLPWELLTGLFVDKPKAELQAQVDIARIQAGAQGEALGIRGLNTRNMVYIGGGIVAILAVGMLMAKASRPRAAPVAGYRRRSRRSRRSRRG